MQFMKTKTTLLVLLFGACAWQSSAQSFDSSGDGMLNGSYYFRQVIYLPDQSTGELNAAVSIQGTLNFSGTGGYTFSGSLLDSANGCCTPQTNLTSSGTYVISASGEGYISGILGAIDANFPNNDSIVGLVSHGGIFIGSTTENITGYYDMFIAAPIGSSPATNSTFNGAYTVAYVDPTFVGDALFTLNANGQGYIGTVNATEYIGNNTTASGQTLNNVSYSFSNGAAQLNLGGTVSNTVLLAGSELLYISPDGSFVFGGSYNGFDMFAGARNATSSMSNYNGLYYQAGLDALDAYFGSVKFVPGTTGFPQGSQAIGHQRVNSPLYGGSIDYTYYDAFRGQHQRHLG
jgi:hypothetical protein